MEKYRRFRLVIDYCANEGKLNEEAITSIEMYNDIMSKGNYLYRTCHSKGTYFAVDINIDSGTPLSVAAKQARNFVIHHRDTEADSSITEGAYDDLIYTLDSISN
jgi:hypothetical protein